MSDRTQYKAMLYSAANTAPAMDRKFITEILDKASAEFLAIPAHTDNTIPETLDWFVRWFGDEEHRLTEKMVCDKCGKDIDDPENSVNVEITGSTGILIDSFNYHSECFKADAFKGLKVD